MGPLVRAFAAELGQERALAIVGQVIRELARQSGGELAQAPGRADPRGVRANARPMVRERCARDRGPRANARKAVVQRHAVPLCRNVPRLGIGRPGREPFVPARLCSGSGIQPRHSPRTHADDHGRCFALRLSFPARRPRRAGVDDARARRTSRMEARKRGRPGLNGSSARRRVERVELPRAAGWFWAVWVRRRSVNAAGGTEEMDPEVVAACRRGWRSPCGSD